MVQTYRKIGWLFLTVVIASALVMSGCGGGGDKGEAAESYTIGVLNHSANLHPAFEGFKARMTELGYTEGENIIYLYDGPAGSVAALDPVVEDLKTKDLDLLLTLGTPPTSLGIETFGDEVPVIFAPVNDPIAAGFVASLSQPGGNATGIQNSITTGRALEWLLELQPEIARVYVPHNPNDGSSVASLSRLTEAAATLEVELVVEEVATPDDVTAVIENLPDDVDAVFILRSGIINARAGDFAAAAIEKGIPVAITQIGDSIEAGVLVGYGADNYNNGQQAARLADQVFKGGNPAELPVEVADSFLGVNLVTAEALGIEVSDSVLQQATQIIRPTAN